MGRPDQNTALKSEDVSTSSQPRRRSRNRRQLSRELPNLAPNVVQMGLIFQLLRNLGDPVPDLTHLPGAGPPAGQGWTSEPDSARLPWASLLTRNCRLAHYDPGPLECAGEGRPGELAVHEL